MALILSSVELKFGHSCYFPKKISFVEHSPIPLLVICEILVFLEVVNGGFMHFCMAFIKGRRYVLNFLKGIFSHQFKILYTPDSFLGCVQQLLEKLAERTD